MRLFLYFKKFFFRFEFLFYLLLYYFNIFLFKITLKNIYSQLQFAPRHENRLIYVGFYGADFLSAEMAGSHWIS